MPPDAALQPVTIDCPRCGRNVSVRFYGPCPECAADLVAKFTGEGRVVEVEAYEPKMHVTPNAVALKDD